jgi:serine/threonine protein kinase
MLVSSDGRVLLGDFGVSAWLVESGIKRKHRQTFVGTRMLIINQMSQMSAHMHVHIL